MKAVYIQVENNDEAFYLNDFCIIMNDTGAGECNPVFDVARETASALGLELTCFENVPEPSSEGWDMREVYDTVTA